MCKPPANEWAVEQQPAQRPAAQHAATPAAATAAAAPHSFAFHHHNKRVHITHQALAQLLSASHDRHQPPQIKDYRYEISTSTRGPRPVFAQRVLSNRLATHQREKVPMASRNVRARRRATDAASGGEHSLLLSSHYAD